MRPLNPARHEERRQHILAAAFRCFARNGFHRTRTAEICAEAGMSPGNLFHYFADKDSLILSLVEADQAETTARFAAAAEAKDAWRALTELLDHQLALCADPAFVRLTLDVIGEAARHPILMGCVQRSEAARRLSLQAMLHRHAGSGQLRLTRGPEAAADWFLLLMDGVLGRAMVEPDFSWTRYRADLLAALHLHIQLRPAKRRKPRR